jgi:hypothetical protein
MRGRLACLLLLAIAGCGTTAEVSPSDDKDAATVSSDDAASEGQSSPDGGHSDGVNSDGATAAALDCTGTFGPGELVFEEPQHSIDNLTLPSDELEVFYAQQDPTTSARRLVVRKRSSRSSAFSDPMPVTELAALCPAGATYDLSADGLRLYVACAEVDGSPGPLRLAVRATRNAAFTISPESLGTVASSFALTPDELTGYASVANQSAGHPLVYRRSSGAEPFGEGVLLPNLQAPFYAPEPTPDGLALLGALALGTKGAQLVIASRSDASQDFAAAVATGMPMPATSAIDGSPTLTADCRSLYWVRVSRPDGGVAYSAMVAHR